MLTTSHSLIQRACRLEPAAWERLCALYGPIIYGWCRRGGLQDSDAADAVQEVFRSVFTHLEQFRREGGVFHAWLWKITANHVCLRATGQNSLARSASEGNSFPRWRCGRVRSKHSVNLSSP